jgi:hypothetical protein
MNKSIFPLSLCCAILLTMLLYQQTQLTQLRATAVASPAAALEETDAPLYIVRDVNGVLAVYPYGSDTAVTVTDIRLSSLRDYDKELMQRGFPLYSEQELTSFLEDFGS